MRPPPGFLYPTELKRFVRESRTIDLALTVQHSWPTGDQAARRANHLFWSAMGWPPFCQARLEKIFSFSEYSEYPILLSSRPTKGALRNVNNAGRDAVDADGVLDEGI